MQQLAVEQYDSNEGGNPMVAAEIERRRISLQIAAEEIKDLSDRLQDAQTDESKDRILKRIDVLFSRARDLRDTIKQLETL